MLAMFWMVFAFFVVQSYECNLRAYLIAVDYEDPINGNEDLLRTGHRLFLPRGTNFDGIYAVSPFEAGRKVYEQVTHMYQV